MPDDPAQTPAVQDPSQAVVPPAAEPVATPPAAQPAAPAAPSQARPWDNDLAFIQEPGLRSQVSNYLAETWQPHVTQIEQSNAQATDLLRDFQTSPRETLLEVADEIFEDEPEKAKAIREALGVTASPTPNPAVVQPAPLPEGQHDPEVQALLDWKRSNDEKAAFDAEFEGVQAAHPDLKFDRTLYIAEVADQGDFDRAVASYRAKGYSEYLTWKEEQTVAAAAAAGAAQPAPATLPAGQGATQTQQSKPTLHEALDNFFDTEEAKGNTVAPPVPTG